MYYGKWNNIYNDNCSRWINKISGIEVPNNSNPSKKAIIGRAIEDLGGSITKDETLYQRYRKLTKMVLKE